VRSMRSRIPMGDRVLVPVHFNATMATRTQIENYAEERGISLGAALREIITEGLVRAGSA